VRALEQIGVAVTASARLTKRARVAAAGVAALALLAAGCGGSSTASGSAQATHVRVLLDWFPNPDHIGFYTAQAHGDFTRQGLDVTLTPPSDQSDPLKLVSTGRVPLGVSYEPDTLIARAQGLHVTAVAAVVPVALNSLIAPDTSPVKSPAQLAGHTIGAPGLPSDDVYLSAIYQHYGIDPKTVHKVNVSTDLVVAMLSRKVDATIDGYRNVEAIQLADRGLRPMVVPVTAAGVPPYDELVLVANSEKLASDAGYRSTVRRFVAGLVAGTKAAIANPTVAERALAPVAKGYRRALLDKMVDATAPLLRNPRAVGWLDIARWQSFADWMLARKLLPRHVDAKAAATNSYLPNP
jgi:putative hydroxymethylpyrimidine transport system substrate-binding protein